jgi:hypothetical protein
MTTKAYSREFTVSARVPEYRRTFVSTLAVLLLLPVTALGLTPLGAQTDSKSPTRQAEPGTSGHQAANAVLPGVTIETSKELRRQVHDFVAAVITRPPCAREPVALERTNLSAGRRSTAGVG